MEVRTALCPYCSGRGYHALPVTSNLIDCRLCDGEGFITPEVERLFFDCARHGSAAPCVEKVRNAGDR